MARPPLPTKVHELKGSYDKNPQRRRGKEPKPKAGIGPYPKDRPTEPADCWDFLVGCLPAEVAGDYDRPTMLIASDLMAKHNADTISASERNQLISILSRYGMTPSDRAKLAVKGAPENDGWDDI